MTSAIDRSNPSSNPFLDPSSTRTSQEATSTPQCSVAPSEPPPDYFQSASSTQASDPSVDGLMSKYKPSYSAFLETHSSTPKVSTSTGSSSVETDNQASSETEPQPVTDFSVTVRRFAPFSSFGGGFHGDAASRGLSAEQEGQGGFSTSEHATSRVKTTTGVAGESIASASESSPSSHWLLGSGTATPSIVERSFATSASDGHIDVASAASNPLTYATVTPDIHTRLQADYLREDNNLILQGDVTGDDFPNAEVYVSDRIGNSILLETFQTSGGRTLGPLLDLPGAGDEPLVAFNASIPLQADGTFRMTCE